MVRTCGTPRCFKPLGHLGLCDETPTRAICKYSPSAQKMEASRLKRFGAAAGVRKISNVVKHQHKKMDPPKFAAGDRVEVPFDDKQWYAGVVQEWVRLARIRTYKYKVKFDSGLELQSARFPLEKSIIAEGAPKPAVVPAGQCAVAPDPAHDKLPPGWVVERSRGEMGARRDPIYRGPRNEKARSFAEAWRRHKNPYSKIRFGDRVRVAWNDKEEYDGTVINTTQRLEGSKAVRGIEVSYDDRQKLWHYESEDFTVMLLPNVREKSASSLAAYNAPGMDVASDSDEEMEAAPAAAPAAAQLPKKKRDTRSDGDWRASVSDDERQQHRKDVEHLGMVMHKDFPEKCAELSTRFEKKTWLESKSKKEYDDKIKNAMANLLEKILHNVRPSVSTTEAASSETVDPASAKGVQALVDEAKSAVENARTASNAAQDAIRKANSLQLQATILQKLACEKTESAILAEKLRQQKATQQDAEDGEDGDVVVLEGVEIRQSDAPVDA